MVKKQGSILFILLILLLTPGIHNQLDAESRAGNLKVVNYSQPNLFYCGPTVIFSILNYWGVENLDFQHIVDLVYDRRSRVSTNSNMVVAAEALGFKAYSFQADFRIIKSLLKEKIPVIVFQNFSTKIHLGHFRIVVGIDLRREKIYLLDPSKRTIISKTFSKFSRLWQRGKSINNKNWAMVWIPGFMDLKVKEVLRSPVTYLNNATYYYKTFQYFKALTILKQGLRYNPRDPDYLKYYTQVLIRLGMYDEATETCSTLMAVNDTDPVVFDLLGLISFYQKDYSKALELFSKAMDLNKNENENPFIKKHYNTVKKYVSKIEQK